MSRRTAAALLFYVLLAVVLRYGYGTYHPVHLAALVAGTAMFAGRVVARPAPELDTPDGTSVPLVFSGVLLILALLIYGGTGDGAAFPIWVTAAASGAKTVARIAAAVLVVVAAALVVLHLPKWKSKWKRWQAPLRPGPLAAVLLALAAGSLVTMRIATLVAAPDPAIDVFVTNTLACDYLAAGVNPYSADYPDIYDGAKGYAPGFFYWPAYLYFAAPFRAFLGDVRTSTVAADLLTALLVVLAARRVAMPWKSAVLVALLWLCHPVSLIVLELAWVDPVLICGIAAAACCILWRRYVLLGVVLGLVAATKQYGALVGLLALPLVFAEKRRAVLRVVVAAALAWIAMLGPFWLLDGRAWYERTVGVYVAAPMRDDALSVLVFLKQRFGVELPGLLLLGVYASVTGAAMVWIVRRKSEVLPLWAGLLAACYGVIFLLGKLAFCNYYYLVAFLVLLYVVFSTARGATLGGRVTEPAAPGGLPCAL